MKNRIHNIVLVFISFLVPLMFFTCATIEPKHFPEWVGVDPRAVLIVKEYKELAKIQGIEFKNDVTIGFKSIKENNTIGLTTYGGKWREIDIDVDYWNKASNLSRYTLLFHELTHAYCKRSHNYGNGTEYPETEKARIKEAIEWQKREGKKPGRYEQDSCPTSLMYPVVLDDQCMLKHYDDYIKEMFNRCIPW